MEKAGQAGQESVGLTEERSKREDKRPNVKRMPSPRTLAFNKPYGVLPCFTDAQGRPTLADYVKISNVYAAGRLDMDSEGLMLLTSDGALAHHITDPQHKLPKIYLAQVERVPSDEALKELRQGILLKGTRTRPAEVQLLSKPLEIPERAVPIRFRKSIPTAWLQITLREGLNRQVRRMTASVGHPTLRLIRIAIGSIVLGELKSGQCRELTKSEIEQISSSSQSLAKAQACRPAKSRTHA